MVCFGSGSYKKSRRCKYGNRKAREMEGEKHISESARRMQKARVGALCIKAGTVKAVVLHCALYPVLEISMNNS